MILFIQYSPCDGTRKPSNILYRIPSNELNNLNIILSRTYYRTEQSVTVLINYQLFPKIMRKTLHQINNHTTCIIPSPFIELPVLRHESEWSCICVLVVMYMCVSGHVYVC